MPGARGRKGFDLRGNTRACGEGAPQARDPELLVLGSHDEVKDDIISQKFREVLDARLSLRLSSEIEVDADDMVSAKFRERVGSATEPGRVLRLNNASQVLPLTSLETMICNFNIMPRGF